MTISFKNGGKPRQAAPIEAGAQPKLSGPSSLGPNQSVRPRTVEVKPTLEEITRQNIAEAAYFLWLKRGGDEIANWIEAEAALKNASLGISSPG
ncbi:MAG: DUF2934 domain-containing protein [Phycisphaerales bacterium]|nr:DUF2934 domain-containing protein [Phycisphaerales bacterium]